MRILPEITISLGPTPISPFEFDVSDHLLPGSSSRPSASDSGGGDGAGARCHGFWYSFALILPSVLFVAYLVWNAKKNLKKLSQGRWHVMVAYYSLLWFATILNLFWCFLQVWQCTPGKEVSWNLLSLGTTSAMLCLEMSLLGFLLQEDYMTALNSLARTFTVAGFIVSIDALFKATYVFGFGVPMFSDDHITEYPARWGLWLIHRLLLTALYGYILFVHYSKWRETLPPRPAFHRYITVMFTINVVVVLGCGLAGVGISFGNWLYDFANVCYHSLYLPFLYVTFLADFFQEEDIILDNAYYSEMRDAGFFDSDWE